MSFPWSSANLISARGLSRSGVGGLCSSGSEVASGAGACSEAETADDNIGFSMFFISSWAFV